MAERDARIPVIVGVGQVNDRPDEDARGLDSLELMEAALRAADADAGGGWLKDLRSLAVIMQISCPGLGDVPKRLAEALGAAPAILEQTPYPMGDGPVRLLNEAARRIASGEIETAAIVGGEALRTAARRAKAQGGDALRQAAAAATPDWRRRYGLVAPTDVYPLYENAMRAALGQTLAEAQAESAAIWSRFSEVAAKNEGAWLRTPRTAEEILTVSADNRPIAFPYTKLMVANSAVNQGAGFIVTSLAKARAAGIAEDRLVYVGAGAAAHEPFDYLARDRYDRSASMAVSLTRALEMNGLAPGDLDCVELYSCFPCVPKLARRVIDWPIDRPATVFGGLTFGGGPVGDYMSHAVAAMVETLRREGRHGLLFGNGGFATSNHAIVVSRDPGIAARASADFDVQAEADAARGAAPPLVETYAGPATLETYTVLYERSGEARFGIVVARTPEGARFLARAPGDDAALIAFLTSGAAEPAGSSGEAVAGPDGMVLWRRQ